MLSMVTKELLKTEIDNVQDEYLEILYKDDYLVVVPEHKNITGSNLSIILYLTFNSEPC